MERAFWLIDQGDFCNQKVFPFFSFLSFSLNFLIFSQGKDKELTLSQSKMAMFMLN